MNRGTLILCLLLLVPAAVSAQVESLAEIVDLIEGGRLEEAERALRSRLDESDGAEEHDLLGVVLSRRGRLDEAEQHFLSAADRDPSHATAHQHLGRLYLLQNRPAEARQALRRAAGLGQLERDLAFGLAKLELSGGDPSVARNQLQTLVDRFDSVKALILLARLQTADADLEGALATLRRALDLAPNSEAVLSALAETALEAGEPVIAVVTLDPLARMHPTVPRYTYLAGIARLQARDISGAADFLRKARALEPTRVSTLVALGLALNAQKNFEEAAELLRDALRFEPDNVDAMAGLALAEEGLSNLESSESYATRALTANPDHPIANLTLGMVRMKQARYAEALSALEQALAVDPGSPKVYYQLSLAYARLKDPEQSRRYLELYRQAHDAYEDLLRELEEQGARDAGGGMRSGGMRP